MQNAVERAFSFLYRNERTATSAWCSWRTRRRQTFSFLYRNERTATLFAQLRLIHALAFQFPLSERTNCNSMKSCANCAQGILSVSSIGTNELQHDQERIPARRHLDLSVSSIGTNELQLRIHRTKLFLRVELSVSSIGTNELQLIALHQKCPK